VAFAQKAPRMQTFQDLVNAPKELTKAPIDEKILDVVRTRRF
jgi:hypothetical protein